MSVLLNLSIGALCSKRCRESSPGPFHPSLSAVRKMTSKVCQILPPGSSLLGIPGESSYILEHIMSNFTNNVHKLLHWWLHSTYLLLFGGCVNFGCCGPGLFLTAVKTFRLKPAWGGGFVSAHRLQSTVEESQGRISRQELMHILWRNTASWLVPRLKFMLPLITTH